MKVQLPHRPITRRHFLKVVTAAAVGHSSAAIGAVTTINKSERLPLIYIHLDGGISQIESFDPKPDSLEEIRGQWTTVSNTPISGVKLSKYFSRTARLLDGCTLIRALDTGSSDHQSSVSNYLKGGNGPAVAKVQTLGLRWGDKAVNGGLPYCFIHQPGYFYSAADAHDRAQAHVNPVWIEGPEGSEIVKGHFQRPDIRTPLNLKERQSLLKSFDSSFTVDSPQIRKVGQLQNMGLGLLSGDCTFYDSFNLPEKEKDHYGRTMTGYSCLLAKQFILKGAGAVTINVQEGHTFDLHGKAFPFLENMVPKVDRAVAALLNDVINGDEVNGPLRAVVLVTGDFGRTPRVNKAAGRDHFPVGNCALLCGGKFRKGAVLGRTNLLGHPVGQTYNAMELANTVIKACGGEISVRDPRIGDAIAD